MHRHSAVGLLFGMLLCGCISVHPEHSVGKVIAQDIKSILDVRFSHISLSGVRMTRALLSLSDITEDSNLAFQWSIQAGLPASRPPRFKDPIVNIKGSNITLREILDDICRQSGWSYEPTMDGHWFLFQAPPNKTESSR